MGRATSEGNAVMIVVTVLLSIVSACMAGALIFSWASTYHLPTTQHMEHAATGAMFCLSAIASFASARWYFRRSMEVLRYDLQCVMQRFYPSGPACRRMGLAVNDVVDQHLGHS